MPTFTQPAVRGLSKADALLEAAAVAPIQRAILRLYEVWHPSMVDGPVYLASNKSAVTARIEPTADRNAAVYVEHLACALNGKRPDESPEAGTPEIAFSIDYVNGILEAQLRVARGSLVPWVIIERVYASDDLSGPLLLPVLRLELTDIDTTGISAAIKASFGDSANRAVPVLTFKREEYSGLS